MSSRTVSGEGLRGASRHAILPPTSTVRHRVVAFAAALAVITYIDRVCLSQAEGFIRAEFPLTRQELGWAFTIFGWMYGLFEIPWGWLGDRIGPRKVLMRIVACWSFFTAATGWTWNLGSLIVTQALFGAGEAGCFPNLAKVFTRWLPANERARAQGILWLSARWGGAFTPLFVQLVLLYVSWRGAFALFGSVGIVWAILFYRWYRDDPRQHPAVDAAERALVPEPLSAASAAEPVPWRRFLGSKNVWMLLWQYFFLAYGAYFYITWLPGYLKEVRHVHGFAGAILAGLPLFFAGLGSLFCGTFISRFPGARRAMAIVGFGGASVMTLLSPAIEDPVWAMIVLGLAGFANDLAMPASWSVCMDLGGKFAGTLGGAMNMMSCLGASLFPFITGRILETWTRQDWTVVFYVSAGTYFVGMLCWFFIHPERA